MVWVPPLLGFGHVHPRKPFGVSGNDILKFGLARKIVPFMEILVMVIELLGTVGIPNIAPVYIHRVKNESWYNYLAANEGFSLVPHIHVPDGGLRRWTLTGNLVALELQVLCHPGARFIFNVRARCVVEAC